MDFLLAPESWPFLGALLLVIGIGAIEGVALVAGTSVSGMFDGLVPSGIADGGVPDSWMGWLHVGRVPLLVLLVILLTAFAFIGLTINGAVHSLAGMYVPTLLTIPLAILGALPIVRSCGAVVARLMPRDESSAVTFDTLVGRVAVIVNGTARSGFAAEARVKNEHGQTLYVRVEPDKGTPDLTAGESVLLVKQIAGTHFSAIRNPRPDLL